jgi:hypothetical protein
MIGKNPLFVSRQHGHSVTTMWRTYAAWMDGALESDIVLIEAAMKRVDPASERVANLVVTGLGTRLATRHEGSGPQVPEKIGLKEVAERVGLLAAAPLVPRSRSGPPSRSRSGVLRRRSASACRT